MSETTAPLRVEDDGHVRLWTLDRPDQRNPVTGADMIEAIEVAVDAANDDAQLALPAAEKKRRSELDKEQAA